MCHARLPVPSLLAALKHTACDVDAAGLAALQSRRSLVLPLPEAFTVKAFLHLAGMKAKFKVTRTKSGFKETWTLL